MNSLSVPFALLLSIICASAVAEPLTLSTYPIRNFAIGSTERQFGSLEFLGGIELVSPDRRFGGISGLEVLKGGQHVVLVSDRGYLVTGDLRYEEGLLTGIESASIKRVFPDDSMAKNQNDIEDIALDPAVPGRGALVTERQKQAVLSFHFADGHANGFVAETFRADSKILRSNRGLESVAFAPAASPEKGRIVVIAEDAREPRPDRIPGWILGAGKFEIVKRDEFDISSAKFLPDGDLILLERRYSPGWGVGMRLRRISAAKVKPGAELDGDILIEAGLLNQIDNMEGLAVHTDGTGRTVLTMVSDDNNSILQRTVLLQFALPDEISQPPAATE